MIQPAQVFVRLDKHQTIIEINSSIFIKDTTDWTIIDEGSGDTFCHAQGNYLTKGLTDLNGKYNYKYNGDVVELTDEEKQSLYPPVVIETELEKLESRVSYLESLHEEFNN